jgi:hypothetical protein
LISKTEIQVQFKAFHGGHRKHYLARLTGGRMRVPENGNVTTSHLTRCACQNTAVSPKKDYRGDSLNAAVLTSALAVDGTSRSAPSMVFSLCFSLVTLQGFEVTEQSFNFTPLQYERGILFRVTAILITEYDKPLYIVISKGSSPHM